MADNRLRQLMQESLDGDLSPDARQLLEERVQMEEDEMLHYDGLRQVHMLLSSAPFERAPARLAMKIMERLASQVKAQPESEMAELVLSLSLSVVTLAMMPMLVAASWLVMNAMADPAVLIRVIEQAIALLVMILKAILTLLEEAQALAQHDPETAKLVMTLIPVTLLAFLRYMEETFADESV
jgi:hypothetical protein